MTADILTPRLYLKTLSAAQLELCLKNLPKLEAELGISTAKDVIDINVTRAINMKLAKMAEIAVERHDWLSYWMIVVKSEGRGIGLIGFKGYPDADGKTEVGYGIGAAYRNQGYVTEALKALTIWAFTFPECRVLTASAVSNPASEKVLQKSGWKKVRQHASSSDWETSRINFTSTHPSSGLKTILYPFAKDVSTIDTMPFRAQY